MSARAKHNFNAPSVPFFIAAVVGVLLESRFHFGLFFWELFFYSSIIALFSSAVLSLKRKSGVDDSSNNSSFIRFLKERVVRGNVFAWLAITAFFGVRYEKWINYFPEREIGRFVTNESVVCSLQLRVKTTPRVQLQNRNSLFGRGDSFSTTFLADVLGATNLGKWEVYTGRTSVVIDGVANNIRTGDVIVASGRLSLPKKPLNPGDRDSYQYYRARRVLTIFSVSSPNTIVVVPTHFRSFQFFVSRTFESLRLRAGRFLSARLKPRNSAVARGMTLGFREDVDAETNDSFRKTGTVHLLAISGLHITLVVGSFVFILYRLGLSNILVAITTIALTLFYLFLTDVRAPVIRASILIIVYCVATIWGRKGTTLNTLTVAALFLLLINPCELFQLGTQLSFLATGTFIWLNDNSLREKAEKQTSRFAAIRERRRILVQEGDKGNARRFVFLNRLFLIVRPYYRRYIKSFMKGIIEVAKASFYIWIVGTPLLLKTTNLLTPIALIANPIVWIPATLSLFMSFALLLSGFLSSILPCLFGWCVPIVSCLTDASFDCFLGILDFIASPKYGAIHIPAPKDWMLWAFYIPLVFWTLFPSKRPRKIFLYLLLCLWINASVVVGFFDRIELEFKQILRVEILAVGHGCAVLGFFPDGRTFLYDCGNISDSKRVAEIVERQLWLAQKTRLDLVVISHADSDHYVGLTDLIDDVLIERVCVTPTMFSKKSKNLVELENKLKENGIPIETIVGGESFERFGFPELNALHPVGYDYENLDAESNENSLVVLVDYYGRRLLLPGDLDATEVPFLSTSRKSIDVMLAPHHGGRSENNKELLEWGDPSWIVISGGSILRNRKLEEEWRSDGRNTLHTNDEGQIRIDFTPPRNKRSKRGSFKIETFRSGSLYDDENER